MPAELTVDRGVVGCPAQIRNQQIAGWRSFRPLVQFDVDSRGPFPQLPGRGSPAVELIKLLFLLERVHALPKPSVGMTH